MEMEYVDTNIGRMPLTDYLELKAMQFGFDSYAELLESGYTIDIPKVTDIEEKKYNITEEMYEELKHELFMNGVEAIDDFLGYEHNVEEDTDVTESRMDEVLDQMPNDIFLQFYDKYCKSDIELDR